MKLLPSVGKPNGGRLGNRKERSGCVTCKKRKIKCDEAKPSCYRCSSTGRTCGGYYTLESQITPHNSRHTAEALVSDGFLVISLAQDEREARAFDSFLRNGASALGCQPEIDLWRVYMPQLSHAEPAIRHAAIALGSLISQDSAATSNDSFHAALGGGKGADSFAIHHYQKAIQSTLRTIRNGRGDTTMAGITCVLFFAIEALQGREQEALELVERGAKVQLRSGSRKRTGAISAGLTESFARLAVQWSMFGGSVMDPLGNVTQFEGPISSTVQAQSELIRLILQTFNVVKVGFELKWMPRTPADRVEEEGEDAWHRLQAQQRDLLAALELWHARFQAYDMSNPQESQSVEEAICRGLLVLRFQSVRVWLIGSTVRSELFYDDSLPQFRAAIAVARKTLDLMESSGKVTGFSFELGLVPPLYIITWKCRDAALRREALSLLRRAPAQEGLWKRDIFARVSERVIELEEGSDGFIADLPPDMAGLEIPESMRLKFVKVGIRTTNGDGQAGDYVEFHTLPYGLDGDWCVHREFFTV